MHLPDKLLEPRVWIPLMAVSAGAIAVCARRAEKHLADKSIPLVGVIGAFVFALQMINFPIGGGVSDHIVGASLLAILFGPSVAILCMSAIITIQALLFGDGGVTALGANVCDMGILSVLASYGVYMAFTRVHVDVAVALSTIMGVVVGAVGAAAWVMLSQPYGVKFLTAMIAMHLVSGGVEAVVVVVIVRSLSAAHLINVVHARAADG